MASKTRIIIQAISGQKIWLSRKRLKNDFWFISLLCGSQAVSDCRSNRIAYYPAMIVKDILTVIASRCLFFALTARQSIRNDEVFNDQLCFSTGSGKAFAIPLPDTTKFMHAEV